MDIRGKVDEKIGVNLFNPNDSNVLIGKFIHSNGNIGTGNYNASGWIPVDELTTYYCAVEGKQGYRFVCCYNSNKVVIPTTLANCRSFTTPENCAFVRVSISNANTDYPYAQVSENSSNFVPYNQVGGYLKTQDGLIDKLVENNGLNAIPFTLDNMVSDNVSIGSVVNVTMVLSNNNCVAIHNVSGGESIKLTGEKSGSSSTVFIAVLDEDDKLIYKSSFKSCTDLKMTLPNIARKLIVNGKVSSNPKLYIMSVKSNQYVTEKTNADVNMINESLSICKSIINPSAEGNATGKYLNGNNLVNGDYNTTDYMPATPGETYFACINDGSRLSIRIIQFYTNTKLWTGTVLQNVNTFTIPEDASYVRVSFANDYRFDEVSINNYDYTFIEYGTFSDLERSIKVDEISINLVNPYDADARQGYYYASNYTQNENLDCTGYISVKYGITYIMHTDVNIAKNNLVMRFVAFFTKNKEFINYVGDVESFTVNDDSVAYAIVSFYNRKTSPASDRERSIENISVTEDSVYSFTKYKLLFTPSAKYGMGNNDNSLATKEYVDKSIEQGRGNVLEGKKWVACGDSFTHGDFTNSPTDDYIFTDGLYAGQYKVYPFFIGRRNKMTIINEAINGSTMTHISTTSIAFSDTRYQNIPSDADYITIKLGINDDASHKDCPIGTINDNTNETFYGAWNVVLDYLIQHHPQAKIGIIVTNGSTLDIVNATIAIAQKWGIAYLNEATDEHCSFMFRSNRTDVVASVRTFRDSYWFVDATLNHHPNAMAHEYESTVIENWLRSL